MKIIEILLETVKNFGPSLAAFMFGKAKSDSAKTEADNRLFKDHAKIDAEPKKTKATLIDAVWK